MIDKIQQFFSHPFFTIFGGISATIVILVFLLNVVFWFLGLYPLLWRFGYGRWFRKISILAKGDYYKSIKNDLVNSCIFREKKIFQITSENLSETKLNGLFVVHYKSFSEDEIKEILSNKSSQSGIIFYFPEFSPPKNKISDEMIKLIGNRENTTIVNFRGRLLNDIMTTLITTSNEKRKI